MQPRRKTLLLLVLAALGLIAWLALHQPGSQDIGPIATLPAPQSQSSHEDAQVESSETRRSAEPQAPGATASVSTPGTESPSATAIVRARCVDDQQHPISGVKLVGSDAAQLAVSADDGRIEGRVRLPRPEASSTWFALREPFHRRFATTRVLSPEQLCDLGDVIMPLGGRILGRVINEKGDGVADAWVASNRMAFADWETRDEAISSQANSGSDGSFALDGVTPGTTRIRVLSAYHEVSELSPLEVVAGQELRGVEIRIGPRNADSRHDFIVRVRTPGGEPAVKADVRYCAESPHNLVLGTEATDAQGACTVRFAADAKLTLRAADADRRFSTAYAFDIPVSMGSIELRMDPSTQRTLIVVDAADGAAIERFAWRMIDEMQYRAHDTGLVKRDAHGLLADTFRNVRWSGSFNPEPRERSDHPGGRVDLFTPQVAFALQIEADGYQIAEVGPFAPRSAPSELRVTLRAVPGVRGRVLSAGVGVANTWVKLFPASEPEREVVVAGFPSRVIPNPKTQSRSAADGSFALTLREAGDFVIQAGLEGSSDAAIGPVHIDPSIGMSGIELELPPPGAIEGRLLVAGDEKARDRVVGASRCDGHVRSVRTDADGRFHFELLAPGRWLLHELEQDMDPLSQEYAIRDHPSTDTETPFTCEVRPGETTKVDIDLRQKAEVVAEIDTPGWDGGHWVLWLEPRGSTFARAVQATSADSKHLRISAEQPGDYDFLISGRGSGGSYTLWIQDRVRLVAGGNSWKFADPTGELALTNKKDETAYAQLECELGGARRGGVTAELAPHKELRLILPLGRWARLRSDGERMIEVGSADITRTGAARMDLQ
jgi:hypothetical protein